MRVAVLDAGPTGRGIEQVVGENGEPARCQNDGPCRGGVRMTVPVVEVAG